MNNLHSFYFIDKYSNWISTRPHEVILSDYYISRPDMMNHRNINVLEHMLFGPSSKIIDFAAFLGKLTYMDFLHQHGMHVDQMTYLIATRSNNINCVRYVIEHIEHVEDLDHVSACICAIDSSNVEMVQYIHELNNNRPLKSIPIDLAINTRNFEILDYLYNLGYPLTKTTYSAALFLGKLDIIRYLHERRCRPCANPYSKIIISPFSEEQFHIVEYMHQQGVPMTENFCNTAASTGQLQYLQFAHEHGCPWNEETCTVAAKNGHIDCLQYAHEHGCPWNEDTYAAAAKSKSRYKWNCLQYAIQNNCPCSPDTIEYYRTLIENQQHGRRGRRVR